MAEQSAGDAVSFRELEQQAWTAKASAYDAWVGSITTGAIGPLVDSARVGANTRVLDVACGPGYAAGQAVARGATAVGLDFAPTMIAEARRRFPAVDFREGDGERLTFEEDTFDAVICGFGLLHMPNPDRAIAEAWRVLRSGGRYAFTVWAAPDRHEFFSLILRALQMYGRTDVPLPPAPPLFRFSDPAECQRALGDAGFADLSVQEVPLTWRAESPEAVLDMVYKSTVRAAMLLADQLPEARERVHRAIIEGTEEFARDGGYTLAFPAVLAAGSKP